MSTPIYITGAGVLSAIGLDKQQTLQSLLDGKSGIGEMHHLASTHHELPVGEVPMSNEEMMRLLGVSTNPYWTRSALMGAVALREALAQARLDSDDLTQAAFVSATTVGGMDRRELVHLQPDVDDHERALLETYSCGSCTEMIADYAGRFASLSTLSTACSSAANALILAANLLKTGEADIVVAGGTEALTRFHLNGFHSLMILDHDRCRPFDAGRAGLNLGEGAAYVVLESAASVARRAVTPLASQTGYGNACDAFHQTASSDNGEGAYRAMMEALAMAGLKPSDIDYVNAHGTGTPNNDASESVALQRVYGQQMPPVSSTKSMTGHTTSASGSIETVICLLAMQHGIIPANVGWQHPMEDGIKPTMGASGQQLRHVMCNAFGFGGNDSSLVFSRVER